MIHSVFSIIQKLLPKNEVAGKEELSRRGYTRLNYDTLLDKE